MTNLIANQIVKYPTPETPAIPQKNKKSLKTDLKNNHKSKYSHVIFEVHDSSSFILLSQNTSTICVYVVYYFLPFFLGSGRWHL